MPNYSLTEEERLAREMLLEGREITVSGGLAGRLRAWARRDKFCKERDLRVRGGLTEKFGNESRIRLVTPEEREYPHPRV